MKWIVQTLLSSLLLFQLSHAQDSEIDPQAAREAAEIRVEAGMVKMDNLVEALAMNLGQLHYLRTLCFGNSDQKWRDVAGDMVAIEAPDNPVRKSQLIKAFNNGYYQEQQRHDVCTETVSLDVAALAENGRNISAMLGDPYREN